MNRPSCPKVSIRSPFGSSEDWKCKRCIFFDQIFKTRDFLNHLEVKNIQADFFGTSLDKLVAQPATHGFHYIVFISHGIGKDASRPEERAKTILSCLLHHKYHEETCEAEITTGSGATITLNIWQWVHQASHVEVGDFERRFPMIEGQPGRCGYIVGARHRIEDRVIEVLEKRRFRQLSATNSATNFKFHQFGSIIIYPYPWGMFANFWGHVTSLESVSPPKRKREAESHEEHASKRRKVPGQGPDSSEHSSTSSVKREAKSHEVPSSQRRKEAGPSPEAPDKKRKREGESQQCPLIKRRKEAEPVHEPAINPTSSILEQLLANKKPT